jgi:hypothetical protein
MENAMRFPQACLASILVSSTAAAQTTLVAHYRLDETSGTVAADSSGTGNDGVYTGAGVTLGQAGVCQASTSVEFDGIDGYVAIPSSPSLDGLSSDFTVASWVNLDVDLLMRVFANQRVGGIGGSWAFGPLDGGRLRLTTLGLQDFDQQSNLSTGTWHHIAVVFDANFQAHFYLDGVLEGTVFGSSPANPPNPGWFIAVLDLTGIMEFFDGKIDDVQVYSGSATAADILFLFQNPCEIIASSIGTNYCISAVNSTGTPSAISAVGSSSISANDLVLTADNMPDQPGIFIAGPTANQVPFFNGFLCVAANGLQRFINTAPASGGVISEQVDIATAAQGGLNVMAGSSYFYQRWFRDPIAGGGNANFSDGIEIAYTP